MTTDEEVAEFLDDIAEERGISRDDAEYVMDKTLMFVLGKKLDEVKQ